MAASFGRVGDSADSQPKYHCRAAKLAAAIGALAGLAVLGPVNAADVTYDFTTDPSAQLTLAGSVDPIWVAEGGNPGGFAAITWPIGSQNGIIVFPNTDPGRIVTGFTFTCDLRVGNSTGDRAADGFAISFARDNDPFLTSLDPNDGAIPGALEGGTRTGVVVSFDTWSGNQFPTDPNDVTDIEGIIVRVDNVTVQKVGLPTRHGTADDITSLQTGPRDAAYWASGGDPQAPESWATLAWRPFGITLTTDGKLTVSWKGNLILNNFQTTYFPTAGQLVMAGRTGGANEHTHVDNIRLTTVAEEVTAIPGAPPNFRAAEVGARRVKLAWDAAVVPGEPNARVAYEVLRGGTVIAPLLQTLEFEDRGVTPGQTYNYTVRGKNIAGNPGPDSTTSATTTGEVAGKAFLKAEQWTGITGTAWDGGVQDPHAFEPPDRVRYVNGFSFGETSNFGDTWGENHLVKITGVFKAPKSGNFRFFVRSDDGSALFIKQGTTPPDPTLEFPIAQETGCCLAFQEVNPNLPPEETSEPVALTAGQDYGITFVVKEGGGGDWGQVAIREEGELFFTPAASLTPLRGETLSSMVDPLGATVTITTNPQDRTVTANSPVTFTAAATGSSPYGGDYGNAIVYTWYNNNVPVLGQNGTTYTIPAVPANNNGNKIKVVATVAGASATSTEATLTVDPDTVAPTVSRVGGSDTFDSVTVVFSEPVADPSATTASNYQITGLTVNSATRVSPTTIRLSTSAQAVETSYPITVNGVRDLANLPSAFTGTFVSFKLQRGIAVLSTWRGQTGGFGDWETGVKDLPPTDTRTVTTFFSGTGIDENFFGQLKGLFIPATTGSYVFYVAGDDHTELYLSTDENPANKKRIAEEPSWSDAQLWIGDGTASNTGTRGEVGARANISDEYQNTEWSTGIGGDINLVAGNRYYIEVLYKEGGGGDHGAATFKLKGGANPPNGSTALTGDLIAWYIDPTVQPPLITQRPTTVKYNNGETISFTVVAESALPVTYQWYQNKKAIPGANSATLTIPDAGVANVGDYYVDVTNANGTATSFPDNDSRAIMRGAYVIEAEDYNHGSGQTVAAASTMPLAADLYRGLDGIPGIDFHNGSPSGGGDGDNGNSYRNGWVNNGTVVPSPTGPETGGNLDVIIDNGNGGSGAPNTERPDFTLANNYKIGWGGTGNWYQYTRNFPPGDYNAVWVGSRDGRDANAMGRTLELVTGDITQQNAATTVIGELTASWTGAWSSNDSIPFLTPGGSTPATFALGPNTTLRLRISLGDGDNDYLLFYPAATPPGGVTYTYTGGVLTLTYEGTLVSSPTLNGVFNDVAGATSPYVVPQTADAQYYGTR